MTAGRFRGAAGGDVPDQDPRRVVRPGLRHRRLRRPRPLLRGPRPPAHPGPRHLRRRRRPSPPPPPAQPHPCPTSHPPAAAGEDDGEVLAAWGTRPSGSSASAPPGAPLRDRSAQRAAWAPGSVRLPAAAGERHLVEGGRRGPRTRSGRWSLGLPAMATSTCRPDRSTSRPNGSTRPGRSTRPPAPGRSRRGGCRRAHAAAPRAEGQQPPAVQNRQEVAPPQSPAAGRSSPSVTELARASGSMWSRRGPAGPPVEEVDQPGRLAQLEASTDVPGGTVHTRCPPLMWSRTTSPKRQAVWNRAWSRIEDPVVWR